MGIQQGLCSISPNYLLAAWKADPSHPLPGNHFGGGFEDQIGYASFSLPPSNVAISSSDVWTVIGTMPGNTSVGPALTCDQNPNSSGRGPTVYAVWKGETIDTRLFFSRLTLPLSGEGVPSEPSSHQWQDQQLIPGASSSSSPSIAFVGQEGFGDQTPLLFTVWSGSANGQQGAMGDNTLWYSITTIPSNPGYVDSLVPASTTNQIPGASSATGACVAAIVGEGVVWSVWVIWFDTVTKKWSFATGEFIGSSISWAPPMPTALSYSSVPNDAGYSIAPATFLLGGTTPGGDISGAYFAWSDESSKIWVTGGWNLLPNNTSPGSPTPMPGPNGQATGNQGCVLFPSYSQNAQADQVGIECDYLFAMWADTGGQLHYAATDGESAWKYLGQVADATTAPDTGLFIRFPIQFPPIKLPPIKL
jgi:hypothetical protein